MLLLEAPKDISIDVIHSSAKNIENILGQELLDIVPAYDSIAIFSDLEPSKLIQKLQNSKINKSEISIKSKILTIPICYELGLDLEHIGQHSKLSVDEIIEIHLARTYKSLFIGFTPGFIYADGLDQRLSCPRKDNPRTHIAAGSVGIGGKQTGIYSLESPGGWNIIGRTPMNLFKIDLDPPMKVEVGTTFKFERISKKEFESWEN